MKSYVVIRLLEKDFGCEGLPVGEVIKTEVFLRDIDGNDIEVDVPDAELYAKDINEGDWVHFTAKGEIVKE